METREPGRSVWPAGKVTVRSLSVNDDDAGCDRHDGNHSNSDDTGLDGNRGNSEQNNNVTKAVTDHDSCDSNVVYILYLYLLMWQFRDLSMQVCQVS